MDALREKIEATLSAYPVCEYAFVKPKELPFRVRCVISAEPNARAMVLPGPVRLRWAQWRNAGNGASDMKTY